MKIVQLLPTLLYGDGVGNDTLAIDKVIRELGYTTKIYAENVDGRIKGNLAKKVSQMPKLSDGDIVIYHLAIGTELNNKLRNIPGRKIIIYHNITPAHFFEKYNRTSYNLCKDGLLQMQMMKDIPEYCWADSAYNKADLERAGYTCPIDVVPIAIPFEDYDKEPDGAIIEMYEDDWVNIVFVGRIAPNKKQEDVIKTFYYYKKYINQKSRLILVGSYIGMERYYERLCKYVDELKLEDVIFTGHIKFNQILAYYHIANVFLCMSEHEGFCIPLLEAMHFQVPIIAYAQTGVKETLGDAGIGLDIKDCKIAAEMIDLLMTRQKLREQVIKRQNVRVKEFGYNSTKAKITESLKKML